MSLARKLHSPTQYFAFSRALFEKQTEFFDDAAWGMNREEIYEQLLAVANSAGLDSAAMYEQLKRNEALKKTGALNYGKHAWKLAKQRKG